MSKVNKDNVVKLLEKYPDLIRDLDAYKSGWGRGEDKKELIEPIITALAKRAAEMKIDSKEVEAFKKKCMKELDATFYTDVSIIISEARNMLKTLGAKNNICIF